MASEVDTGPGTSVISRLVRRLGTTPANCTVMSAMPLDTMSSCPGGGARLVGENSTTTLPPVACCTLAAQG